MKKKIFALNAKAELVLRSGDGTETAVNSRRPAAQVTFLLVDCSGSMEGGKLIQARQGAQDFARSAISEGYAVGVIRFAAQATLACAPSTAVGAIFEALNGLSTGGSTNMTAALELSLAHLLPLGGLRAIVVVTDGQPDNRDTAVTAARKAAESGIQVIAIGTDDADLSFLSRLSTARELAVKVDSKQLRDGIASAARMLTRPRSN